MSSSVVIRTSNPSGEDIINITLEVENGEIINMSGEDVNGHPWEVESIKFTCATRTPEVIASRCCVRDGQGRVVCFLC